MMVSILIVNWKSKDYLRRCLETVRSTCAELSPQIIVVDSGSFDGCGEMLAEKFPEVEFVQCSDNVGFGRANNIGFERVRGDALLLLNPDTELSPGALNLFLKELGKLPLMGILGPRILNSDGSLQTSCVRSLPTPVNQALDSDCLRRLFPTSSLWGTWRAFHSDVTVEVESLSGACMLMKSDDFRRVGGFSPEFFMYGEDWDLCFKFKQMGLIQYYVPFASIVHHGGISSTQQFKKFSTVLMLVANSRVIRKWLGAAAAARYRVLMGISALIRLTILMPSVCLSFRKNRSPRHQSLLKWLTILKWTFNLESWTSRYDNEFSAAAQKRQSHVLVKD